jgi:murein L,D-transpeptidase YcbB/YkuD
VEEVLELAQFLLDDPAWDQAAIANVIAAGETRRVSLRQPVPIYLVYWTVEVQEDGAVHFKRDPYLRDDAMIDVLARPLKPDPARLQQYQTGV